MGYKLRQLQFESRQGMLTDALQQIHHPLGKCQRAHHDLAMNVDQPRLIIEPMVNNGAYGDVLAVQIAGHIRNFVLSQNEFAGYEAWRIVNAQFKVEHVAQGMIWFSQYLRLQLAIDRYGADAVIQLGFAL